MTKHTILINKDPVALKLLLNGKSIESSEKRNGYQNKTKLSKNLNYLNFALFLQYLSNKSELKKLAPLFKEAFQFCTLTAPVSQHFNGVTTKTNLKFEPKHTFSQNFFHEAVNLLFPATVKKTSIVESLENSTIMYEQASIRYLEPSFLAGKLEIKITPVESDLQTVSLSMAKTHQKILSSYENKNVLKNIDSIIEALQNQPIDDKTILLNLKGNSFNSCANYVVESRNSDIQAGMIKFLEDLKPYAEKIINNKPTQDLNNVSYGEYKGIFSKTENLDKNKSYMYIASTPNGKTGFLGIALTPHKASTPYRSQYSLKVVQSLSGALIFPTPNYKECGIGELTNKNYYSAVEAVECSQIFRMKDTAFADNKIQAFASALQKAQIDEFMSNLPIEEKKPEDIKQSVARRTNKI